MIAAPCAAWMRPIRTASSGPVATLSRYVESRDRLTHPMRVTGPSPMTTCPAGLSRTTGSTGADQASPYCSERAARSARVITPLTVGGRMERVTPPLALPHLSDLSDEELAQAYAPLGEPWLRVNFVSTVDGAAQGD